ncbi:MAG: hypothetical protein LC769_08680, partial [Chloroflexi bacterium]|nr:hypothetical protein [Chloroflexota bacterium]
VAGFVVVLSRLEHSRGRAHGLSPTAARFLRRVSAIPPCHPADRETPRRECRVAHHLVLVVSSDPDRRALVLLGEVRPALLLIDAALADGRAVALLQALRRVPVAAHVPVVVRGPVTLDEQHHIADDLAARGGLRLDDDAALYALLATLPRPA